MPEYEVSIVYRLEYSASKLIKAKDEDTARARIEQALTNVDSFEAFEKYIHDDINVDVEECEIDDITEV